MEWIRSLEREKVTQIDKTTGLSLHNGGCSPLACLEVCSCNCKSQTAVEIADSNFDPLDNTLTYMARYPFSNFPK